MATSGTYTETRSATTLILDAHLDLGIADPSAGLTTVLENRGIRKLNDIINQLKGPPNKLLSHMKMWQRERVSITLDSTKNSYSLKPSGGDEDIQIPEEIESVLLQHTSSATDTPLPQMNLTQYEALPAKAAAGIPQMWYYEKRLTDGKLYIDCKPSSSVASAYTLEAVYRQPLEIIVAGTNELDAPNSIFRMLEYQLALDLAPGLNIHGEKFSELQTLRNEATMLANSFEPEDVDVYFEPERDD